MLATRADFAHYYGQDARFMALQGELILPCDCGDEICQGWGYENREMAQIKLDEGGFFTQDEYDAALAFADELVKETPSKMRMLIEGWTIAPSVLALNEDDSTVTRIPVNPQLIPAAQWDVFKGGGDVSALDALRAQVEAAATAAAPGLAIHPDVAAPETEDQATAGSTGESSTGADVTADSTIR